MAEDAGVPVDWTQSTNALTQVLTDNGTRVASDPARLRGSVTDVLGASAEAERAQVDAIVVAAEEGVAAQLLARRRGEDGATDAELTQTLVSRGFAPEFATNVIAAWTTALSFGAVSLPPTAVPSTDPVVDAAIAGAALTATGLVDSTVPESDAIATAPNPASAATELPAAAAAGATAAAFAAPTGAPAAAAPATAKRRGGVGLIAAGVAAVLLLVGGGAFAATRMTSSTQAERRVPSPTATPVGPDSPSPTPDQPSDSPTPDQPSDNPTPDNPTPDNPTPKPDPPQSDPPQPVPNRAPVLVSGKPATYSTTYKVGSSTVSLASFFTDPDGDAWSLASATASKGKVTLVPCGGGAKCLTYKPSSRSVTADTIAYKVKDSKGATTGTYKVAMKVVVPNTAPVATSSSFSGTVPCRYTDSYCYFWLTSTAFKDPEGDKWKLSAVSMVDTPGASIVACPSFATSCPDALLAVRYIPPPPGASSFTAYVKVKDALGAVSKSVRVTLAVSWS